MRRLLPDPIVVQRDVEPEFGEDVAHRLSPWGVQRDLEALSEPLQVPQVRVRSSVTRTVPTGFGGSLVGFATALAFNAAQWDLGAPEAQWSTGARVFCRAPGLYWIHASVRWDSDSTGQRQLLLAHNNASIIALESNLASPSQLSQSVAGFWRMDAGDDIQLGAAQDSGGTRTIQAGSLFTPVLSWVWLSP